MLPRPLMSLSQVFSQIKSMQKQNLNQLTNQAKDDKGQEQVKGLKFIARKLKILLQKNRRIQYNDASRILINNFATAEKDERNIKRRVYDAINVLVAAQVISKQNNKIELNMGKKKPNNNDRQGNKLIEQIRQKKISVTKKNQELMRIKEKHILLKKFEKKKKIRKQQKIQQPKFAIFQGKIDTVKFQKLKKKTVINMENSKILNGTSFMSFPQFVIKQ